MGAVEHDLDAVQWAALLAAWGGCAYCGAAPGADALQRDCVLPISRGGRYTWDNVVPACRSCNASKCNTEVTAWMRRRRLDERQFLLRHAELRAAARVGSAPGAVPLAATPDVAPLAATPDAVPLAPTPG
ncbi:hypothetical protein Q760_06295 [Cellulomonas cellasea DSM 20118]|uniref:HNH nuclease domain-containing protein n=3 Tax=Cellulomonas cellasea TaxID=43670 RepID=A0A0A0B3J6_9CELL|nr:hypothetical protein Q760_06295 [Cellulomonas cellasea DSM 20118]GEA86710.1 hypothetical protein CCE01nite_06590 [Cellulomonas cellasea]